MLWMHGNIWPSAGDNKNCIITMLVAGSPVSSYSFIVVEQAFTKRCLHLGPDPATESLQRDPCAHTEPYWRQTLQNCLPAKTKPWQHWLLQYSFSPLTHNTPCTLKTTQRGFWSSSVQGGPHRSTVPIGVTLLWGSGVLGSNALQRSRAAECRSK